MSGPTWRAAVLTAVCVAQLAIPAWMLVSRERVLAEGEPHRFECAPVDPVDVFRGRYVALGFTENPVKVPEEWPHSSYGRAVDRGWYPPGWGRMEPERLLGMNPE